MGQWVGAQGRPKVAKISKNMAFLWRHLQKSPTENEKHFFDFDYKTCWIRGWFG